MRGFHPSPARDCAVRISSVETLAFGPTRIIWVHPPDELLNRCR